jgi:hypothetical protein
VSHIMLGTSFDVQFSTEYRMCILILSVIDFNVHFSTEYRVCILVLGIIDFNVQFSTEYRVCILKLGVIDFNAQFSTEHRVYTLKNDLCSQLIWCIANSDAARSVVDSPALKIFPYFRNFIQREAAVINT